MRGADNEDVVDDSKSEVLVALVGVLGIEFPPNIGRVLDLNDVERVNMRLFPLELDKRTRRLGGRGRWWKWNSREICFTLNKTIEKSNANSDRSYFKATKFITNNENMWIT